MQFLLSDHGLDLLHNFISSINAQHNNIYLTSVIFTTTINFLDVTNDLDGDHISTKICAKSTDTHSFLSYNSFHPRHIKQSIIYSQFLRYKRICYNEKFSSATPPNCLSTSYLDNAPSLTFLITSTTLNRLTDTNCFLTFQNGTKKIFV